MKTIMNKLTFTVLSTLIVCSPAHAMWRTAGQKLSRVGYTAAQQVRTALAGKLLQTGKALQGTALQRGLTTAYRMKPAPIPELRPATTRMLGTASRTMADAAQSVSNTAKTLHIAKQLVGATTAVTTVVGAAYGLEYVVPDPVTDPEIQKELTVEYLNKKDPWQLSDFFDQYKNNPEALNTITEFVAQNFTTTDDMVLDAIMERNPAAVQIFAEAALTHCSDVYSATLELIMGKNSNDKEFLQKIKSKLKELLTTELHQKNPVSFFDKLFFYKRNFFGDNLGLALKDLDLTLHDLTITEQHILHTNALDPDKIHKNVEAPNRESLIHPYLRTIVNGIINLEREAARQGYYTFAHGQRWEYLIAEKLFTDLWSIHASKPTNDFIFLHVRPRDADATEKKIYKKLMKKGRGEVDDPNRQHLLFANGPLFGNIGNGGSSTVHYFICNTNIGSVHIPLKQVFELRGDGDIYVKYAHEFDSLQKEYDALSSDHGNILVLLVPKKLAQEYVYLATPGGYKKKLTIKGKKTDDIHEIMDALAHKPEQVSEIDKNEFCIIMTGKAMDPESGIKVKIFNAADQATMQAFWNKYDALMDKIKADIDAKQAGKLSPSQDAQLFEKFLELWA